MEFIRRPFLSRNLVFLVAILTILERQAFCQTASRGNGESLGSASSQPASPSFYVCQSAFLHGYKLKGVARSNTTEPFLICPTVTQNCCSKRDQLYIFHYLRDIIPPKLSSYKSRRDNAMKRVEWLHRRLTRTNPDYSKLPQAKQSFCSSQIRLLFDFKITDLMNNYFEMSGGWERSAMDRLDGFMCGLCDGSNHLFFDPITPKVTVNVPSCLKTVRLNDKSVRFWLNDFMNYALMVQNVVDCNHYTNAFNLTFFDAAKLEERNKVLSCLNSNDENLSTDCEFTCNKLGFASLTTFIDGDPSFLEEMVNVLNKNNFHRETGKFISMEMRHYFKRFRATKQLNETEMGVFRSVVNQSLQPVIVSLNVADMMGRVIPPPRKMSLDIMRERLSRQPERRLRQKTVESPVAQPTSAYFKPSNQQSAPISRDLVDKGTKEFMKGLSTSSSLLSRRRLQSVQPTNNGTQPVTRKPRVAIDSELSITYDNIPIEKVPDKYAFIFLSQTVPVDLDKITRQLSKENGFSNNYSTIDLSVDPTKFYQLLYKQRPPDKYNKLVDVIVGSVPVSFNSEIRNLVESSFTIDVVNYFVRPVSISEARKLKGKKARKLIAK